MRNTPGLLDKTLLRMLLAEAIGTFILVVAGTGAIIVNDVSGGVVSHTGIALVFGLIVLSVIYSYGDISGAHINPAVTVAFWHAGRFPGVWVLPYIISQCMGAICASLLWQGIMTDSGNLGATLPHVGVWQAFLIEFMLTWWLMTVILGVSEGAKEKGLVAGIVIGAVVALEALFAGPLTGASMNPARSLGPAMISGNLQQLWLYLSAPVLGAMTAVWTCRLTKGSNCCKRVDENDLIES